MMSQSLKTQRLHYKNLFYLDTILAMEPKKIAKFMLISGIVTIIIGIVLYKMMETVEYTNSTHQTK